jgi:hypothetical protein
MIPMELISMLGSTVLGGIMSIMAQKGQAEAERQKMLMARAGFAAKQTDKARDVKDAHTKHTRTLSKVIQSLLQTYNHILYSQLLGYILVVL